jgi:hypothetical protein
MTYSETPQLQPIVLSYRLRILSDEQLGQLKSATLEILEETGIHYLEKEEDTRIRLRWPERRRTRSCRTIIRSRWRKHGRQN